MFSKIKAIKNLRDQAKGVQATLEQITVTGEAGWGKVKISMNGNQKIMDIEIADELLADKAKLVETLKDAFADTHKNMQKRMAEEMKNMGGLQEMMKNLGM